MLTFTAVNINRDEYGAIKADPLVKARYQAFPAKN